MKQTKTQDTFEKFSQHFRNSLKTATLLAQEFGHSNVVPAHIFYGLLTEHGSIAGELLRGLKLNNETIKNTIITSLSGKLSDDQPLPQFSPAVISLIAQAVKLAYINKHKYIGTEHLLIAVISSKDPLITKILEQLPLSAEQINSQISIILKTTGKLPEIIDYFSEDLNENEMDLDTATEENQNILDFFGQNLTNTKIQASIDPIIGRERELRRIIEILSRRTKNNPLLLGDPGVGKTAIIEGLAKKILEGKVPEVLLGKKIYTINLSSIVAGTSFRGEFEARIKDIITEAKNLKDVILFIDEIHQLVGAGSASGSMDAANILKPALARGDIKIIGATTYTDYRKSIENDPALSRRFQTVRIEEPTAEEAKNIIKGIREFFENFHGVAITDEAIESAVDLSQKYINEKFLPDKAIDLIDESASAFKVNRLPTATELELKNISQQLVDLEKNLKNFIIEDDFDGALKIKNSITTMSQKIKAIKDKLQTESRRLKGKITTQNIATTIGQVTGIPVAEIIKPARTKILALPKELKQEIIGQDQAIDAICARLKRAQAGLSFGHKPVASFLFVGPSGTGKTHTARTLAKQFFGSDKALIKIDMSEFGEKFNSSKLIGAPAGYVGYKESGQLTEKIKHQPHSLVLFDEIEKANQEIFDLLLQILEDGYLTDGAGTKIDFSHTAIVMTSNLGSEFYNGKTNIGFDGKNQTVVKQKIAESVKKWFKPEFLNRLDQVIFFNQLGSEALKKIAEKQLTELSDKLLQEKSLKIDYEQSILEIIINHAEKSDGLTETKGARGIRQAISEAVEDILAQAIISGRLKSNTNKTWRLKAKNGIITLT